jgi:hypothetical protein
LKTIAIHGIALDLPEDHWLLQVRGQLPDYSENIGRLAAVVETKYPARGFIDVGANAGETAAIVCAHSQLPVLCIEGAQYRELLEENVHRLRSNVEWECGSGNGAESLSPLCTILARHASFQGSKILKIAGGPMYGPLLESALDWIATAHPILYWKHSLGPDTSASGQRSAIFDGLLATGYRTALVFDHTGEFMQTISLDARRQLTEIGDYLPGGKQLHGYGDVCAFHEEDVDLGERFRQVEVENRGIRRKTSSQLLSETSSREVSNTELTAVRAHTGFERHRLHHQIAELEARIALKDAEMNRLHTVLRDLLRSEDLKVQLAGLRQELDSSLALRVARSLHWLLGPIRRRIGPRPNGGRP